MNKSFLKKFKIKSLKEIPHVKDRVAKEKDMKEGRAVFYLPKEDGANPSKSKKMNIPCFAYQKRKTPIIIVQAERTSQGVVLGVRYTDGSIGICMLDEVELL